MSLFEEELYLLTQYLYYYVHISSLVPSFLTDVWLTISTTLQQPLNSNLNFTHSIQLVVSRSSLSDGLEEMNCSFQTDCEHTLHQVVFWAATTDIWPIEMMNSFQYLYICKVTCMYSIYCHIGWHFIQQENWQVLHFNI